VHHPTIGGIAARGAATLALVHDGLQTILRSSASYAVALPSWGARQ
jgi:hypothetical protein